MMKVWTWCRSRPWTWAVAAALAAGGTGYFAGRASLPDRVESTASADTAGRAESQAQLQVTEQRGRVVTTRRVTKRPAPGGGVVELTTTRRVEEPVVTQLGATAAGSSSVVTHQEERRVEERSAGFQVGATVGYAAGVAVYGGWVGVRAGPLVLLGHGEAGKGTWGVRAGAGLAW